MDPSLLPHLSNHRANCQEKIKHFLSKSLVSMTTYKTNIFKRYTHTSANRFIFYLPKVCVLLSFYIANFRDDFMCFNCNRYFIIPKQNEIPKKSSKKSSRKKATSTEEDSKISRLGMTHIV